MCFRARPEALRGKFRNWAELADVVARLHRRQHFGAAIGQLPVYLEQSRFEVVNELPSLTLTEKDFALCEMDLLRPAVRVGEVWGQLDHPVRQLADAIVVRRVHDDPAGTCQVPHQPQDALDLDVVEVGRWLVGQDQWLVVHQQSCGGHSLLLSSRQLGRAVVAAFVQPDEREQLSRPGPSPLPAACRPAE